MSTRVCRFCGLSFTADDPRRRYCSEQCKRNQGHALERQRSPMRVCEYCGCEFQPARELKKTPQRFCSKRCGTSERYHSQDHEDARRANFWQHVQKGDGCWEWDAYRRHGGYGEYSVRGDIVLAHRYAWELTNGPIPDGLLVCHKCDNPPCCNPDHLFLGTIGDNARDMFSKGRHQHGTAHRSAKLTPDDVRAIRASSLGPRALSRLYGVYHSSIRRVLARETWKDVD